MIGENWLRVALTAMALGVGLYLVPLGMVANPDVIALAESTGPALLAALKIALGLALISWALVRKKAAPLRGAALALGLGAILWPL
jgi:TRAP-type uncharacterized transport system fused permease subunit